MRHKADSLKKVHRLSRLSKEYITAPTHGGSFECGRLTAVFQYAVNEEAINEVLAVECKALTLNRLTDNFVQENSWINRWVEHGFGLTSIVYHLSAFVYKNICCAGACGSS